MTELVTYSAADAYAGVRCCLLCARDAADDEERLEWLHKAMLWLDIARAARRKQQAA